MHWDRLDHGWLNWPLLDREWLNCHRLNRDRPDFDWLGHGWLGHGWLACNRLNWNWLGCDWLNFARRERGCQDRDCLDHLRCIVGGLHWLLALDRPLSLTSPAICLIELVGAWRADGVWRR